MADPRPSPPPPQPPNPGNPGGPLGPGRNELCDHAWPTTPSHADDRYRQHRCGQPAGHTGPHHCRYQHAGGTR